MLEREIRTAARNAYSNGISALIRVMLDAGLDPGDDAVWRPCRATFIDELALEVTKRAQEALALRLQP